ncbi:MAG: alpha-L-fucosidase [Acidobacteria bacterium]|nr:MAG: alpha-L-fucosidase [Acidobacteriota bacterium]
MERRPRPTPEQLAWQQDELALFVHFGVNTFTDREWGDGKEDPAIFNPSRLDAEQWARTARAAGARAMVLTAKHHDGFCLWPTATTPHSVASSPFRGGRGDVVGEFVDACRANRLKAGLYLSPWDRNAAVYGDSPRYNEFYWRQLRELLTGYGRIDEVWFDGANGEGPNGKRQTYDWPATWALVQQLQPHAVMFSDAGPGVRWIGNENGVAGETNWSTVDPLVVPVPGTSGAAATRMMQQGDPRGSVWRPGETDVSIRPGWFHHPAEDARVRSIDNLVNLYFTSVGRNSKLLLNVPPTKEGLLHDVDVERLTGMRAKLNEAFLTNLASGRKVKWTRTGATTAEAEVDLRKDESIGIIELRERIERGQTIARYRVDVATDAGWQTASKGTTIGYKRLTRLASPIMARRVRVVIEEAIDTPEPIEIRLYP